MTEHRMSAAQKVLTGGMSLLMAQGTMLVLTFLAQRIILSTLTKEANGFLFAERRFVDLFVIMAVDFGMNGIIMRRAVQEPDRAHAILSSAVAARLGLWAIATALVLGSSLVAGYDLVDVLIWSCYLLITARTGLLRYAMEIPGRSQMRFGLPTLTMILDSVLFLGGIWMLRDSLTPSTVIATYAAASLPGFLIILLGDRGQFIRPGWVEWGEIKKILLESVPVFIAFGLMNVHDKIDAVLLDWFSTQREVGIYGAAYVSLAPLTGTVPLATVMVLVPVIARFAKTDWEACRTFSFTGLRILVATAVVLCSVLSVLTPLLIELISKGRYADNQLQYMIFMWMPVPLFMLVYIQEMMIALGHQRLNVRITGTLAVVTLVAGLALIPSFASIGAASTKLIAIVASTVLALILFRSILKQGIDLQFVLSLVAITVIAVGGAVYLPTLLPMWVAAAAAGGVAVAAVFLGGMVRRRDITLILQILRQRKQQSAENA